MSELAAADLCKSVLSNNVKLFASNIDSKYNTQFNLMGPFWMSQCIRAMRLCHTIDSHTRLLGRSFVRSFIRGVRSVFEI